MYCTYFSVFNTASSAAPLILLCHDSKDAGIEPETQIYTNIFPLRLSTLGIFTVQKLNTEVTLLKKFYSYIVGSFRGFEITNFGPS